MDYVVESTRTGWAFGVQDDEPGPWGVRWWRRPLIVRNGSREVMTSTAQQLSQIAEKGRGRLVIDDVVYAARVDDLGTFATREEAEGAAQLAFASDNNVKSKPAIYLGMGYNN